MSPDDGFVRERRAAAVFKYGILRRHPAALAARVGAWAAGRRAVFIDGFPGPGQYEDGTPGAPLLVARDSGPIGGAERSVTGIYVEGDRVTFASLRATLAPFQDYDYRLFAGELADHLPGILQLVPDSVLFALLDPCSTALDHEQLTGQLLARGLAPTEVLVHLDVATLARAGSALRAAKDAGRIPHESASMLVDRLDRFLGGPWWHRDAMTVTAVDDLGRAGRVAARIAGRFAAQAERDTGFRALTMPTRFLSGHLPKAVFVAFARTLDGLWHAADTLGQAGMDWYEAWRAGGEVAPAATSDRTGQLTLFDDDESLVLSLDAYRKRHEPQWVTAIERNIVRLLVEHGPFVLAERAVEVFGDTLGLAGETHVRRALRNLHDDGLLADDGRDDRYHVRELRPVAAVRTADGSQQRPA